MNGNTSKITNWDRRALTRVLQLMRGRQEQGAIVRVDEVAEAIANRLDIMGEHGLCDMIRSAAAPSAACDRWNDAHPIGTAVDYRETADAKPLRTTTRSPAQLLGNHTAVLWLEGKAGAVALDHVTPAT